MATVGLSMIVKDEAHVILRCLDSLRGLVDRLVVVDTGSTDGTQRVVRDYAARHGIAADVLDEPWRDFASNRNAALDAMRRRTEVDYVLVIDADDVAVFEAGFDPAAFKAGLDADVYDVVVEHGPIRYPRPQLFSNRMPFAYRAVLHEFLVVPPEAEKRGAVSSFHIAYGADGGRSRDPDKYRNDAALLERALAGETDALLRARYTFYLAQSYRDGGAKDRAEATYLRRAGMGGWDEEMYCSLLYAGRLGQELERDPDLVLALYGRAAATCPWRAEAAHAAARLCRELGRYRQGYDAARAAEHLAVPPAGLFVEGWIHAYGLRDELSVNAYWSGLPAECRDACLALLACEDLPGAERTRVVANLRFALDRLGQGPGAPASGGAVWRAAAVAAPPPRPAIGAGRGGAGSVSVITPTRDRAGFLRRAARHLRAQTHADLEWLILDDGAEPFPAPAELAGGRVTYRHSPERLTVGEKRNRLIDEAKGDTIVQFDDDDHYAPAYVGTMLAEMAARGADLVNLRGWFLYDLRSRFFGYWDLTTTSGPHYRLDDDGVTLQILDGRDGALADAHLGFGFSYAFRRRVWQASPFPHVDWDEDGLFARAARGRFAVDGFHDTAGLCLHVLHRRSSSRCYPQHMLPSFMAAAMFPGVDGWGDG